jgi:malonyl-CoA O-methyltransferase
MAMVALDINNDYWIVEGAGGIMVPINEQSLMLDLMRKLALPIIVAARTTLGTINHTLLTLTVLKQYDFKVAGVVMVGEPNMANREAIETFSHIPVLAEMPIFSPLTSLALSQWIAREFDRANLLMEYLK